MPYDYEQGEYPTDVSPTPRLTDKLHEMKMEFYEKLNGLITDDETAERVIELLDEYLAEMDNFHFLVGLQVGSTITADYLEENQL